MADCKCDVVIGNMGTPGCVPVQGIPKKYFLVPLVADDGTENRIDLDNVPDQAAIEALVNQSDRSKALYPTPRFTTITVTRADNIVETFDDQSTEFLFDGIQSVEAVVTKKGKANPQMIGQMKQARCTLFGVYEITNCNELVGENRGDGYLYPKAVDSGSWAPFGVPGTDTTGYKVQLNFNFDTLLKEEDQGYIAYEKSQVNLLAIDGLKEYTITEIAPAPTTTEANIAVKSIYGAANNKLPVTGLLLADVSIYNDTQDAAVVPASVTEGNDGEYNIVYPAQTLADVLTVTITKTGLATNSITLTAIA